MTNFDCEYSYDAHGNILTSSRNGLLSNGQYGNLGTTTMIYNGNQLASSLSRVAVDFERPGHGSDLHPIWPDLFPDEPGAFERLRFSYDSNGNMISSMDADIAHIEYNYLNLPQNISRSSASPAHASYTYDSDGSRLKLVYHDGDNNLTTVDWCGNLVYVNGELDKILFDGGFIRNGEYYFFATDHLGSIRAVSDSQGNILQATHYYPYGEEFADSSSSLDFQPYKFTGKEDQSYAGIPMTYFGARFLAHPYSQWTSIDPLAEKYYSLSPYSYCGGNPVNAVDPDGKDCTATFNKEDKTVTISATFYYLQSDSHTNQQLLTSLDQAIGFWNSQTSCKYTDPVSKTDFAVKFNLTTKAVSSNAMFKYGNSYTIGDPKRENATGITRNKRAITIDSKYAVTRPDGERSSTGAHEVGHTLGMTHKSDGIMSPSQDSHRTLTVPQKNINEMIGNASKETVSQWKAVEWFKNVFTR